METKPSPTANWTVMVYFAADNDLEDAALANLALMKKVGSSDKVNLLAQLDTRQAGKTFRYHLNDERTLLAEDVREVLPEINTGDPDQLSDFITWAMKEGPADHYLLVLWGHGDGWDDVEFADRAAKLSTNPVFKPLQEAAAKEARSYSVSATGEWRVFETGGQPATTSLLAGTAEDTFVRLAQEAAIQLTADATENGTGLLLDVALSEAGGKSQDSLRLSELGSALKKALGNRKLDLLGLDACLMGSAEVAFQVAPYAQYMVASEDVVPRDSWPYDRILTRLHENPDMSPEEFSIWIVREYLLHYWKQNRDVTQAVFNLTNKVRKAFQTSVSDLASYMKAQLVHEDLRREVMLARMMAQTFYLRSHIDLYDFCQCLSAYTSDQELRKRCEAVMRAIFQFEPFSSDQNQLEGVLPCEQSFVLEYGSCGYRMRKARGVSVYFPPVNLSQTYRPVAFNQATNWFDFLEQFTSPFTVHAERLKAQAKTGSSLVRFGSGFKVREGTTDKVREGTTDKIPGRPDITLPRMRLRRKKSDYSSTVAKAALPKQAARQSRSPRLKK